MEITLEITNFCPHECSYCSTNSVSAGHIQLLTVEDVDILLYEKRHSIDRINISGGGTSIKPVFL